MPTSISDLIIPEVVGDIASAIMVDKTALVRAGVATGDYENVDIRQGGEFAKIPFWNEVTGEEERLVEGTALTPDKITMGEDIGVIVHRGKAWSAYTLARIVSGKDPNRAVGEQLGNFWGKRYDAALLSVLKGAFAGPLASTHVLNVSASNDSDYPVTAKPEHFIDAMSLLGDNMEDAFEVFIMHSKVYADLLKQGLIQFGETQMGAQVIATGSLPTFPSRNCLRQLSGGDLHRGLHHQRQALHDLSGRPGLHVLRFSARSEPRDRQGHPGPGRVPRDHGPLLPPPARGEVEGDHHQPGQRHSGHGVQLGARLAREGHPHRGAQDELKEAR